MCGPQVPNPWGLPHPQTKWEQEGPAECLLGRVQDWGQEQAAAVQGLGALDAPGHPEPGASRRSGTEGTGANWPRLWSKQHLERTEIGRGKEPELMAVESWARATPTAGVKQRRGRMRARSHEVRGVRGRGDGPARFPGKALPGNRRREPAGDSGEEAGRGPGRPHTCGEVPSGAEAERGRDRERTPKAGPTGARGQLPAPSRKSQEGPSCAASRSRPGAASTGPTGRREVQWTPSRLRGARTTKATLEINLRIPRAPAAGRRVQRPPCDTGRGGPS